MLLQLLSLPFILRPEEVQEVEYKPDQVINHDQFKDFRVLLVEDNEMNREIARAILEEKGIIVDEANDGDVAIYMISNSEPGFYNAVLMDVQMPKMNGYEATKVIRSLENEELASIPIIAMTANAFDEDKARALEVGMDAHVAKPIDINKLMITLSNFQ